MPVINTTGVFNIGRDCTLILTGGSRGGSAPIQLDNITDFESKQTVAKVKVNRLDGTMLQGDIPQGWSGSFTLERGSSVLDVEFSAREQAFYANGSVAMYQMYIYISETDGSTTTWQFTNVSLEYMDAGTWKGDSTVKQRVSFVADRRQPV